jgi:hypothetical protein
MQTGFLGSILAWIEHPFQSGGSALNWVLWVGLIIVAIAFWQLILLELTREI